jgi:Protein HRI1
MAIPERFRGAWQRVSLSLDGGAPGEPAMVVWVQSDEVFADVRLPRDAHDPDHAPACFAGVTTWEPPHLRWQHHLDLDTPPGDAPGDAPEDGAGPTSDVGLVSWEGGDLVERGTFVIGGRAVPYVEVWRRLPRSEGPIVALASDDGWGRLVRAGEHAITVVDERPAGGAFRACYRTRGPSGWRLRLAVGPAAADLPAPRPDVLGIPARMPGWHQVSAPPEPDPVRATVNPLAALPLMPGAVTSFPL